MATKAKLSMDELLASEELHPVVLGDTIDGVVMSVKKHEILIDLGARGVGLVPRREVAFGRQLKEGDEVSASVIDTEMEDGMVLLSLRKAVKEKGWDEIMAKLEAGEIIEVQPFDANRGGLLVEYEGIRGFLPVSQLSAEHYPRVPGNPRADFGR